MLPCKPDGSELAEDEDLFVEEPDELVRVVKAGDNGINPTIILSPAWHSCKLLVENQTCSRYSIEIYQGNLAECATYTHTPTHTNKDSYPEKKSPKIRVNNYDSNRTVGQ